MTHFVQRHRLLAGALTVGLALASALSLALFLNHAPAPAHASTSSGALYHLSIADHCTEQMVCIPGFAAGDGLDLSAALTADGTGSYEAADHGHYGPGNVPHASNGFHDSGPVTWNFTNGGDTITIYGAAIFGNQVPIILTVPSGYGHFTEPTTNVLDVPFLGGPLNGISEIEVAP